jgi:hypothetical protein
LELNLILLLVVAIYELHPRINTHNIFEKIAIGLIGGAAIINMVYIHKEIENPNPHLLVLSVGAYFVVALFKNVYRKKVTRKTDKAKT